MPTMTQITEEELRKKTLEGLTIKVGELYKVAEGLGLCERLGIPRGSTEEDVAEFTPITKTIVCILYTHTNSKGEQFRGMSQIDLTTYGKIIREYG